MAQAAAESIKAAIPNQPKLRNRNSRSASGVYQSGDPQPAKAPDGGTVFGALSLSKRRSPTSQSRSTRRRHPRESLSKRRSPTSQSQVCHRHQPPHESIKAAIPNQPKPVACAADDAVRVYQSGDPQPAKAYWGCDTRAHLSLSKRRSPTSQSGRVGACLCVSESIKAAIPNQPKPGKRWLANDARVYQSGDPQPAKAPLRQRESRAESLSKRRSPTSQSVENTTNRIVRESIKAAIPNQPKRKYKRLKASPGVYQSGDPQPAKARIGGWV